MDPQLLQAIGIGTGLLAGGLTKKVSKQKGSDAHKVGSPLAALVAGAAVALIGGNPDVLASAGQYGGQAVLAHTIVKNLYELIFRKD